MRDGFSLFFAVFFKHLSFSQLSVICSHSQYDGEKRIGGFSSFLLCFCGLLFDLFSFQAETLEKPTPIFVSHAKIKA